MDGTLTSDGACWDTHNTFQSLVDSKTSRRNLTEGHEVTLQIDGEQWAYVRKSVCNKWRLFVRFVEHKEFAGTDRMFEVDWDQLNSTTFAVQWELASVRYCDIHAPNGSYDKKDRLNIERALFSYALRIFLEEHTRRLENLSSSCLSERKKKQQSPFCDFLLSNNFFGVLHSPLVHNDFGNAAGRRGHGYYGSMGMFSGVEHFYPAGFAKISRHISEMREREVERWPVVYHGTGKRVLKNWRSNRGRCAC